MHELHSIHNKTNRQKLQQKTGYKKETSIKNHSKDHKTTGREEYQSTN